MVMVTQVSILLTFYYLIMCKKHIVYLMHVPWTWIRQRPHFFAEMLSGSNVVKVYYERPYGKTKLVDNITNLRMVELFRLPFNRLSIIRRINRALVRLWMRKETSDIIWLTSPELFYYLTDEQKKLPIIYDCMDDMLEFPAIKRDRCRSKEIFYAEKFLVQSSKLLIFSSDYLRKVVLERYNVEDKGVVINNGIKLYKGKTASTKSSKVLEFIAGKSDVITYVGTISAWFDFDLLVSVCKNFPSVHFALVGPAEVNIPQHPRLVHFGPVRHEDIPEILERSKLLIMPFIVNELIKSVNPVKVYEYINSGNPAVINYYEETDKFDKYVYRYRNSNEFLDLIELYTSRNLSPKRTVAECRLFAEENTWERRNEMVKNAFNCVFK